jgi:hypothetical protein
MSTPIDNRALVWAFNQGTYSVTGFAALLDIGADTLEGLLRGNPRPEGIRLSTLLAISEKLGLPLNALFPAPPDSPDPEPEPPRLPDGTGTSSDERGAGSDVVADAEQLIACLYADGRTHTTSTDLATAFEWTLDRLTAAGTEAIRRLAPAGLTLTRSHGEYAIVPTRNHQDAQTALDNRHATERGLTHSHYKAVYQLLQGQNVSVSNSPVQRQRLLGGLANLGIVTNNLDPALTPEALEGLTQ